MSTMIFYDKPVALNRERHRNLKINRAAATHDFARQTNSVLLAGSEVVEAAKDYPVIFVGKEGGDYTLAALVGLSDQQNLFVNKKGEWTPGRYLPAFVRRYPFVLAEGDDRDSLTVCVDESFPGLSTTEGEPLFDDEGQETPLLSGAVDFLRLFHVEMAQTRAFGARLAELGLLASKTLRMERDGKQEVLDGIFVVDDAKLRALDDAVVLELFKNGYLALVYAHLHSISNIDRLALRTTNPDFV